MENEEKKAINKEEEKKKGFFGKVKDNISTGAKAIKKGAVNVGEKIKDKIDKRKEVKELEQSLVDIFNSNSTKLKMVLPGDKTKTFIISVRIDYEAQTITIYGENEKVKKGNYFIDKRGQKFNIKLIREKQNIELKLENVAYIRPCIVIEYSIENDDITKN